MEYLENILGELKNKVFRRTNLGDAEIRNRNLELSRPEQLVLLAVDRDLSYVDLQHVFEGDGAIDLDAVAAALIGKDLLVAIPGEVVVEQGMKMRRDIGAQADDLNADEFFSSSLDPLHSGSGLVVDTRANFMRSVKQRKKEAESVYDIDIPLSLELDTKLRIKKEKRSSKLVQVFPEPEKPKKRRRSKRAKPVPVSKWPMRIYIALTAVGLILVLLALFGGN